VNQFSDLKTLVFVNECEHQKGRNPPLYMADVKAIERQVNYINKKSWTTWIMNPSLIHSFLFLFFWLVLGFFFHLLLRQQFFFYSFRSI